MVPLVVEKISCHREQPGRKGEGINGSSVKVGQVDYSWLLKLCTYCLHQGSAVDSIMGQILNILGSVGHSASVMTTQP